MLARIDLRGRGRVDLDGALPRARLDDHAAARRSLLDHGVLVRDVGLAGWLRVTVGTDDDMAASRNALTAVLEETR